MPDIELALDCSSDESTIDDEARTKAPHDELARRLGSGLTGLLCDSPVAALLVRDRRIKVCVVRGDDCLPMLSVDTVQRCAALVRAVEVAQFIWRCRRLQDIGGDRRAVIVNVVIIVNPPGRRKEHDVAVRGYLHPVVEAAVPRHLEAKLEGRVQLRPRAQRYE
jgi:hypothetical protein